MNVECRMSNVEVVCAVADYCCLTKRKPTCI